MFKSYLLLAFRQLRSNRGYTLINVAGLAIGFGFVSASLLPIPKELVYS